MFHFIYSIKLIRCQTILEVCDTENICFLTICFSNKDFIKPKIKAINLIIWLNNKRIHFNFSRQIRQIVRNIYDGIPTTNILPNVPVDSCITETVILVQAWEGR